MGNRTSEKYTDINGQPMIRKDDAFAGILYEYNDDGTCKKRQYLGVDGRLTYVKGVSGYVNEYDDNGYLSGISYVDAKGNAAYFNDTDDEATYSKQKFVNDDKGNIIDHKLLDASGELVETAYFAHKKSTYDSLGNMLTEYYFDKTERYTHLPNWDTPAWRQDTTSRDAWQDSPTWARPRSA